MQKSRDGATQYPQYPQYPLKVRKLRTVDFYDGGEFKRFVSLEEALCYADERVQEAIEEVHRRTKDLSVELANKAWIESR